MKKLIIIRHGETDYSAAKRYCGFQDVPLNRNGVKQAERLGRRLKKTKVDRVYSSDLLRARETARVAFGGRKINALRCLREINFGSIAGLRYDDLKKKYPGIYRLWAERPELLKMPGGESLARFSARVERCLAGIARKNKGKSVAIVSHGGPIRVILLKLMKKGLDKMWDIEQNAAALNVVSFKSGEAKILKMNDTSHLR